MKAFQNCMECCHCADISENLHFCVVESPKTFFINDKDGNINAITTYPAVNNQTFSCSRFKLASLNQRS